MKHSDVILTTIPQADGKLKNRPALILCEMPPYGDFLVCGISTQLNQKVNNFDEIISQDHNDFSSSGLLSESLVRLGFLAVIPLRRILGVIGRISPERYRRLLNTLINYLKSTT